MNARANFVLFCLVLFSASSMAQWTPPQDPSDPVARAEGGRATASDPVGDNFNTGPDLTALFAQTDGTTLTLRLEFADTIQPPPSNVAARGIVGGGNEVVGFIDLDVDQEGTTGTSGGNVAVFCPQPPADFGVDYYVNLGNYDDQAGTVDLVDTQSGPVGPVPITFTSNSLTVLVPNALLGDDGIADVATVIGNLPNPTDCAPDAAVLTSDLARGQAAISVPTTTDWGLLAMAFALLMTGWIVQRLRAQ